MTFECRCSSSRSGHTIIPLALVFPKGKAAAAGSTRNEAEGGELVKGFVNEVEGGEEVKGFDNGGLNGHV